MVFEVGVETGFSWWDTRQLPRASQWIACGGCAACCWILRGLCVAGRHDGERSCLVSPALGSLTPRFSRG